MATLLLVSVSSLLSECQTLSGKWSLGVSKSRNSIGEQKTHAVTTDRFVLRYPTVVVSLTYPRSTCQRPSFESALPSLTFITAEPVPHLLKPALLTPLSIMWYLGVRTPTLQPGVETVGIRNSHVRERRDSPPEAKTEDLSRILSGVTNAVEQACYTNSMMFIDKHFYHLKPAADGTVITSLRNGAFPFLYDPLSNITQILKNIGSDVNRYAWPIKHLKAVGDTALSEHSPFPI